MRTLLQPPPAEEVGRRLTEVRRRITALAPDRAVKVVAVTKGFTAAAALAATAAGADAVGENYADELLAKHVALDGKWGLPLHFVGAIQRRRVPKLAPAVACWETVWRPEEGRSVARHAPGATVLVEVNLTGDTARPGVAIGGTAKLVAELSSFDLVVGGLMGVAPLGGGAAARTAFRSLRHCADDLGLAELSMGMTDDLEEAVAEGSTMVRVGRALFGERAAGSPIAP